MTWEARADDTKKVRNGGFGVFGDGGGWGGGGGGVSYSGSGSTIPQRKTNGNMHWGEKGTFIFLKLT